MHQLSVTLLIFITVSPIQKGSSEVTCVKNNNCKCTLDDGTKRFFDLSEISSKFAPYFPNKPGKPGGKDRYFYDPCEPFTLGDDPWSNSDCYGVAACRYLDYAFEPEQNFSKVAIHKGVVFSYNEGGENLLFYDNGKLLYSCSPRRVSRKLCTVYETMSFMQQLRIAHNLLLRARIIRTPAPSIKLCTIASYRLFHSHAQVISFTDSMM